MYPRISEIREKDFEFYKQMKRYSTENETTIKNILDKFGFEITSRYDRKTIINLRDNYKATLVDFANLFSISRQAIDNQLKKEVNKIAFWESTQLNPDEIIIFEEMINQFSVYHSEDDKKYRIFSNIESKNPRFALLITSNVETRIIFKLPLNLEKLLLHQFFHIYNENDLLKLNELNKLLNINGNMKRSATEDEMKLLNNLTQKSKNTPFLIKEDLFIHFGFENVGFLDKRYLTDEDIKKALDLYRDPETNFVKIPIDSDDYHRILRWGHTRGFWLADFIRSFGYFYQSGVDNTLRYNKRKKTLENYVVRVGEVYISSYDPFYYSLTSSARKKNMNLDDYLLEEYNLTRIPLQELPDDYEHYNWRQYIIDLKQESQLIKYIDENLLLDENKVYIDSQSLFYTKVFLYAVEFDQNVTSILIKWGYERTYDRPKGFVVEPFESDGALKIKKDLIMEKIKEIQGALEKVESKTEKIKRSRTLVKLMKSLYLDHCQLCDYNSDDFIPYIKMNNGRYYIEIHHIKSITSELSHNDESEIELDSYKNVIVVCTHHHKVLHFENGGYDKVLMNKKNGKLQFENNSGSIPIVTDYHLTEYFND